MPTRFIRLIAVLTVVASIIGNSGVGLAEGGTPTRVRAQNLALQRTFEPQPLSISAAGSLGVQFIHVATAANIDAHTTLIDNPLTNSNPGAIILVTPNWTPGGVSGTTHNHYVGVFYNINLGQWGIYNEDGLAMEVGDAFNVIIPNAGSGLFVETASTNSNSITIDNPLTNGNPGANILVTPIWNPGGGVSGNNANFPFSVEYNTIFNKWTIFDQSGATIPNGTSFNVFVPAAGAGVFVHTSAANGTGSFYTLIDNPLTNGKPNAIVFVTPNLNPGGLLDEHTIGVFYGNGYWKIYNRDAVNMPLNTSFNVLVLVPLADTFIHKATTGNSLSDFTKLDHALTNGYPNTIIFTTPNLNPGGGGGTYNNHNIGVTYNGSQWRIFNQNGASIPVNGAFNVLVPNPDASVFVHTATAANTTSNNTTIDYPLTNGNPNAILLVTQNYNPGNVGGSSDDHPIGVMYSGGQWRIYNQDGAAMPPGAAFNVSLPTAGPGVAVFVHTATGANSGANFTVIDNALANGNPYAIILVTPNFDPGNICGCVNANFPIGVAYVGDVGLGKWAIINQNGTSSSIPLSAAFNVTIFANRKQYLPVVRK